MTPPRPTDDAGSTATGFLEQPDGQIAYDVSGDGPLVVLVPGMGDLRSSYRFMAPVLRDSGYRVACSDLRGHGDSDTTFSSYGDEETAGDVIALIEKLGGPAVVVGNSMAAGAAVIAAAGRPELVRGLALLGAFVRNPPAPEGGDGGQETPTITADFWKEYLPALYAGRRPADFDQYLDQLIEALRRPGYTEAFALTAQANHDPAEQRLGDVSAPTLVVMGEKDPDFGDARAEAEWIADALHGEAVMIPDAGHYPQSQQPELTADTVLRFLKSLDG